MPSRDRRIAMALGGACLVFIAVMVLAAFIPLFVLSREAGAIASILTEPYAWRVVTFTLWQACLSTVLSVGLAIPLASSLARRDFRGRVWILRLMALPLGLPAIVVALGILAVWGRQGIINTILSGPEGNAVFSVYGLSGILLAHVFFNMPLATRLLLLSIRRIPPANFRVAAQLSFRPFTVFRLLEWPAMRADLAGIAGLIFLLCATSFTLVLVLGGGPGATTIEVAVYQALRFDFQPGRAVMFALIQIVLCALILLAFRGVARPMPEHRVTGLLDRRYGHVGKLTRVADMAVIAMALLFVILPVAAIVIAGLRADLGALLADGAVWRAGATSLVVAFAAATLAVSLAIALARARIAAAGKVPVSAGFSAAALFSALAGIASQLILLVSPIVLGTGWFIMATWTGHAAAAAPMAIIIANGFIALPFSMRIIEPALVTTLTRTGRLATMLGLTGWRRFTMIDLAATGRPIAMAFAFSMALSLGDLGVVALFGSLETVTLPMLLYQKMSSYRTADAAGIALLLSVVCLALAIAGTVSPARGSVSSITRARVRS